MFFLAGQGALGAARVQAANQASRSQPTASRAELAAQPLSQAEQPGPQASFQAEPDAGQAEPAGQAAKKIPILVDTDIGTDIDDAFALALILRSPELDLLGVTTVSGDTAARARLAAKLLEQANRLDVPVAAGAPGKPLPLDQARWAQGFASPSILPVRAEDFLASEIARRPGQITLVALGPLTNIAALLTKDPEARKQIKEIALMGGAIARGYKPGSPAEREYNIAADPAAAQTVFASGVPILMVPLDATAMLQLGPDERHRLFTGLTPLTNALTLLYHLWNRETPTLYDPMAVAMLVEPGLCETESLHVEVDAQGLTHVVESGAPNALVAVQAHPEQFVNFFLSRVAP
jgi:inosine-uridine nucleoside N-ribohydrolase